MCENEKYIISALLEIHLVFDVLNQTFTNTQWEEL